MSKLHAALDAFLLVLLCFIASLGWAAFRVEPQAVGVSLPQGNAVFETSLQSRISASDTSMTLVSNALRGGESLSGYNCFTIDEGRSDSEFVCGTVSGTTVSDLERGLSFSTGTTTVTSLKFAHRVGANVKITDYPLIQRMRHQLSGTDTIANVIRYASNLTFSSTTDIVTKKYVDDIAFSGAAVIDATSAARGVVELATASEAAAGTTNGGSGILVLPSSIATSTCQFATNSVLVASSTTGKLPGNCFDGTYRYTFSATTTFGASFPNGVVFNSLGYSFPASHGASSTALTTNGAGRLSWNEIGYTLLSATTTTATMSVSTTTFTPGNFENLFVVIVANASDDGTVEINFNNDVAGNYGVKRMKDHFTAGHESGDTNMTLNDLSGVGTTTSKMIQMTISNPTSFRKIVTYDLTMSSGTNVAPIAYTGHGVWNNTTAKISSLRFNGNLPSGSRIMVYGY